MFKNTYKYIWLVLILSLVFYSCTKYSKDDAEKYLPGSYLFKFSTGEESIIKINKDFTFNNIIYSKGKKEILYNYNGSIKVKGDKITFYNWLDFKRNADLEVLISNPEMFGGCSGVLWRKPEDNHWTKGVIIIISLESNYVFEKISPTSQSE